MNKIDLFPFYEPMIYGQTMGWGLVKQTKETDIFRIKNKKDFPSILKNTEVTIFADKSCDEHLLGLIKTFAPNLMCGYGPYSSERVSLVNNLKLITYRSIHV